MFLSPPYRLLSFLPLPQSPATTIPIHMRALSPPAFFPGRIETPALSVGVRQHLQVARGRRIGKCPIERERERKREREREKRERAREEQARDRGREEIERERYRRRGANDRWRSYEIGVCVGTLSTPFPLVLRCLPVATMTADRAAVLFTPTAENLT